MLYRPAHTPRARVASPRIVSRLLMVGLLLLLSACLSEPSEPEPLMLDGFNLGTIGGFAYGAEGNREMVIFSSTGQVCSLMGAQQPPTGYYWVASVGAFGGYAAIQAEDGLHEYTTQDVYWSIGECEVSLLGRLLFDQPCERTISATLTFDTGDVLSLEMTDADDAHRCSQRFYNGMDLPVPSPVEP